MSPRRASWSPKPRDPVGGVALLAALLSLAAAPPPDRSTDPPRAVLVFSDGAVRESTGAAAPPGDAVGLEALWVWSGLSAPRRISPPRTGGPQELPPDPRLRVRVSLPGEGTGEEAVLLAAPVRMWEEVPEELIPRWPVRGGVADVPVDPSEPWRVRALAGRRGSFWRDLRAGERGATLAPAPARDLLLAVADATGGPAAEATLSVLDGRGAASRIRLLALARGGEGAELRIPSLPDGEPLVLVIAAPGAAPRVLRGLSGSLPESIRLSPGGRLRGRFVDAQGRPVAGVRLRAEGWISPAAPALFARRAASDEEGRWEIGGLPRARVAISASKPGFATFRRQLDPEGEVVDLGTIRLARGLSLEVLVADREGFPVAGAAIAADGGAAASTGADGLALLDGLAPRRPVDLRVEAAGYLPAEARLTPPFAAPARFALERAFRVTGRLRTDGGGPVGSGVCRVEIGTGFTEHPLLPGGRFELDLPPGTEIGLVLRSPSTRELRVAVDPGFEGESRDLGDLAAPESLTLTGRAIDGRDGSPVAGARIWALRNSARGVAVARMFADALETTTDGDGSFTLTGLSRQPTVVRIDAAGLARRSLPWAPEPDVWLVDAGPIELSEGATLRVSIAGAATEEEIEGAVARAAPAGEELSSDAPAAPVEAGVALLRHVPAGPVEVTVRQAHRLICRERVEVADRETLDVECRGRGVRVTGTVTVGGLPAGPGLLVWQPPPPDVPAAIMNRVSPGGVRQQYTYGADTRRVEAPVGEDGRFAAEGLEPGPWTVRWIPQGGGAFAARTVAVPAADDHEIVLSFPGVVVRGVVADAEGEPVAGARVRELESGSVAFSGASGEFSFRGLEQGPARFQARLAELSSPIATLAVPPEGEPDPLYLTLADRREGRQELRVTGPGDAPAAGALVFLETGEGDFRILTTDSAGWAETRFHGPPPGRLRAAAFAGGLWIFGAWGPPTEDEPLSLETGASGTLRISGPPTAEGLAVIAPGGWDLTRLMRFIGYRPQAADGEPLSLPGLPPGVYQVTLDGLTRSVVLEPDRPTEVSFD